MVGRIAEDLLRPLNAAELDLLDTIWAQMYYTLRSDGPRDGPESVWPRWESVSHFFWKQHQDLDPSQVLADLPSVPRAHNSVGQSYGLVWRSEFSTPQPTPKEYVGLTIAGLHQLALNGRRAHVLPDSLVGAISGMSQRSITEADRGRYSTVIPLESCVGYLINEFSDRPYPMPLPALAALLMKEYVTLYVVESSNEWQVTLRVENLRAYRNMTTASEYINHLNVNHPAQRNEAGIAETATANVAADTGGSVVMSEERTPDQRKVFVIHGRNEQARVNLFAFLRSIGLEPIEWSTALAMTGTGTPYIGDVLDAAFNAAQAVVVLQTPDDIAHLHESLADPGDPECTPQMQPRPNVLYEAGMAMGRNPERTIIVELGQIKVFSDIHGRHVVRLNNSTQRRQDLAGRLKTAGCSVNLDGTDWHSSGDLTPPAPPGGGLPIGRRLPSSTKRGLPTVTARLNERGGNQLSHIVVTNHGPGDIYELDATPVDGEETRIYRDADQIPVPVLPEGKSVVVLKRFGATFGSVPSSYFNIRITGKTADGTPIDKTEFVSGT